MSKSPALLSRRSLLRGAASVTALAALAAVSSCADGSAPVAEAPDPAQEGSALLRLAHGAAGSPGAASPPGTNVGAITSDEAVVAAIDDEGQAVRADFAAGRTAGAAGWLLSATETDVLVAYAGACPLPAC
jgi:hypothetical protein